MCIAVDINSGVIAPVDREVGTIVHITSFCDHKPTLGVAAFGKQRTSSTQLYQGGSICFSILPTELRFSPILSL